MPSVFTPEQQKILEHDWHLLKKDGESRPPKRHSIYIAHRCSDVGPRVTSQQVGQYYSARAARETGRPRAQAKTPRQLRLLEESFTEEPWPYAGELMLLTWQTGLRAKQVKQWFDNQRAKFLRDGDDGCEALGIWSHNFLPQDRNVAARMWRQFYRSPEGTAQSVWLGVMDPRTGEYSNNVKVEEADIEEWERLWGKNGRLRAEECDKDEGRDADDAKEDKNLKHEAKPEVKQETE